jgi:hypothetical protein
VCTLLGKKNLSTGIWFKQVILKGFLRLSIQPVQLIFPTSIIDKKIFHQPSPLLYEAGNGPTEASRTLKYVLKPKGSPYTKLFSMRETVKRLALIGADDQQFSNIGKCYYK